MSGDMYDMTRETLIELIEYLEGLQSDEYTYTQSIESLKNELRYREAESELHIKQYDD